MIDNSAIISALAEHPYTPDDKIKFGGAEHYAKVFRLGGREIEIVYKSGNPASIANAFADNSYIDKVGIVVDATDVYVLKETSPRGTFARYVVLETNTGMQLKGIVDASSISFTKGQSIGAINGGATSSSLPTAGDYKGQLATCEDGTAWIWNGTQWVASAGSGSLPTPSSSNSGKTLKSNGSNWNATNNPSIIIEGQVTGSAINVGKYCGLKILKIIETTPFQHFAFDLECGNHGNGSAKSHIDVRLTTNGTRYTIKKVTISHYCSVLGDHASPNDKWYPDIKLWISNTKELYVAFKTTNSYTASIYISNFISKDEIDLYNGEGQTLTHNIDNVVTDTLEELTRIEFVTTPISTSTNQMLISNGNGGWKVLSSGTEGQVLSIIGGEICWTDPS